MTDCSYPAFGKIPRFNRDVVITEKIDGTNGLIEIEEGATAEVPFDGISIRAGSRNRWLTPGKGTDNYGFAGWVYENAKDLLRLGPGLHYGEWYGQGIQRGYGLTEKRFALFNATKWQGIELPPGVDVVPILAHTTGGYLGDHADDALVGLVELGSTLVPGFMNPEGIIIYHTAAKQYFKVLLESDDTPKGLAA